MDIKTTREWYWCTPKLVCEHVAVTVLRNQGVYINREFTANSPDIVIAGTTTIRPIRERERKKTTGNKRRSALTNYKQKAHREKKKMCCTY
jgi:hypothetical protein